jgi:hypothetical protein
LKLELFSEAELMPNYVPGIGSVSPKLMIIGEAPGKHEDEQCIPFVGPTGQMLNDWLFKAGVRRDECYITNLALQAVCDCSGILNYRGSIITARDGHTKVVPTIHPAALFNRAGSDDQEAKGGLSWTYTKLIEADIFRAVEESLSVELNLPSRTLSIAHSSLDLHRFFREYERLDLAASDIESINCVPVCIGFAFN